MPVIERLAENRLKKADQNKDGFTKDPEVLARMDETREALEQALADTEYFHGTGRKHYEFNGESQYDGINHEKAVDRLEPMVKDGLLPQTDLFAENFTGDCEGKTVSLSKNRMYSRVYADLHMNENEKYLYEYGSQWFWWHYMLALMIITGIKDPAEWKSKYAQVRSNTKLKWNRNLDSVKHIAVKGREVLVLKHFFNALLFLLQYLYFRSDPEWKAPTEDSNRLVPSHWIGRFRKDGGGITEGHTPRQKAIRYNRFVARGKSDIDGNYGMIIGIKKNRVKKKKLIRKAVSVYETRCPHPLNHETWSYMEVPLEKVDQTRRDLRKVFEDAGLGEPEFPVFATEYVEMMMRERSLAELAAKDEE